MRTLKIILAVITTASLSGCNEAIDTVKSSRLNYNDKFTIDEAFSNRKICQKVTWDLIKDDRGRELVQYKCDIKGIKEYYEKHKEAERSKINNFLTGQWQVSERNVEYAKEQVEKREKFLQEAKSAHPKTLDSGTLVYLKSLKEAISSDSPAKLVDLRNYFWDQEKNSVATMIENYEKEYRRILLNRKNSGATPQIQATLDRLKESLKLELSDELKIITQKIKEETDRLETISQKNLTDQISHLEKELESAQSYYSQTLEKENHSRKEFEQKATQDIENLEKRPSVVTVHECFQWVVKEDKVEIVASGLEKIYENEKVEQSKFDQNSIFFRNALARVYQNKLENLSQMQNILR